MNEREIELSNGWTASVSSEGVTLPDTPGMLTVDDLEQLRSALGEAIDLVKPLSSDWIETIVRVMNGQFRTRVVVTFVGRDEHSGGYVIELHDMNRNEHHIARTVGEWRVIERNLYRTS